MNHRGAHGFKYTHTHTPRRKIGLAPSFLAAPIDAFGIRYCLHVREATGCAQDSSQKMWDLQRHLTRVLGTCGMFVAGVL